MIETYFYRTKGTIPDDPFETIGYMKGAEAVNRWFARHVKGANKFKLVQIPTEVMELLAKNLALVQENPDKAKKVFPLTGIFSAKDISYDDAYFASIDLIKNIADDIITTTDWATEKIFYYTCEETV